MRRYVVAVLFTIAALLPASTWAQCANPPCTLTGETLAKAGGISASGQCTIDPANGTTSGTYTFTVPQGAVVTGPYPGTFIESGSFTFSTEGQVEFMAAFQIFSGTTIITGNKHYAGPAGAYCDPTTGEVHLRIITSTAEYDAVIHTPAGSFHDEGRSLVGLDDCGSEPEFICHDVFSETFVSALAEPRPCKFKDNEGNDKTRCKVKKEK
jgi:hypothetical protein